MEKTTAAGYPELRDRSDRRRFTWRTVFYAFLRSRRRDHRRLDDGEPVYVDAHSPGIATLAIGVMIMSSLDAFFTLRLIDRGAREINPFMAAMMGEGTGTFAVTKMVLTGFSVLVLVFLERAQVFNRFRTGVMLSVAFAFYACLVCYEIVLLT